MRLSEKSTLQANLNYYDTGEEEIDREPTPLWGRVVGEYDDHYAIMLEITFVKRF